VTTVTTTNLNLKSKYIYFIYRIQSELRSIQPPIGQVQRDA